MEYYQQCEYNIQTKWKQKKLEVSHTTFFLFLVRTHNSIYKNCSFEDWKLLVLCSHVKSHTLSLLKLFFAFRTKQNRRDVSATYFQNMPIWTKWLLHWRLKKLLHPIMLLVLQGNWFLVTLAKIFIIISCGEINYL